MPNSFFNDIETDTRNDMYLAFEINFDLNTVCSYIQSLIKNMDHNNLVLARSILDDVILKIKLLNENKQN